MTGESMEPASHVRKNLRRVPMVMWVMAVLTCVVCAVPLYAMYHHWSAPYQIKADLRIDRPVMMMFTSLAFVGGGIWMSRRPPGRRFIVRWLGAFMMVLALLIATIVMTGTLILGRPLVAHGPYDAVATEFSNELARLASPSLQIDEAKQAAVSALQSDDPTELRHALALIREAIAILEQDSVDIATLEQRGREMFRQRNVGQMRVDAYFGWAEPLRHEIDLWLETNDAAIARYRDLEAQLRQRLGDPPP